MATKRTVSKAKASAAPPAGEDVEVQLATLVAQAPESDEWIHEVKLDGYRIVARIADGTATLTTRNGNDWTHRAPKVVEALAQLPVQNALLDGEVVSLRPDGKSDFQGLQNALRDQRSSSLVYFAFDLLFLDGNDLRPLPLTERKAALAVLCERASETPQLRYSDHIEGGGGAFFQQACKLGLEGTIAKRKNAPYRAGRGSDWQKIKCIARQEFVIGGYTPPGGARTHLGALLVGLQEDGKLRFAGKVGTGFTQKSLRELHQRLTPLEQPSSPFSVPLKGAPYRGARWVKPVLVCEIAFSEFTQDGHMRHPSFQGMRDDKPAAVVVRETPKAVGPPATKKKPTTKNKKKA